MSPCASVGLQEEGVFSTDSGPSPPPKGMEVLLVPPFTSSHGSGGDESSPLFDPPPLTGASKPYDIVLPPEQKNLRSFFFLRPIEKGLTQERHLLW